MATQQVLHYFLHFIFPVAVAYYFFKTAWKKTYLILVATMLVDLDHLFANPVYEACRCSIGFHPLHGYIACSMYIMALFVPKLRVIAIGLLMHMATDSLDCYLNRVNGCNTFNSQASQLYRRSSVHIDFTTYCTHK